MTKPELNRKRVPSSTSDEKSNISIDESTDDKLNLYYKTFVKKSKVYSDSDSEDSLKPCITALLADTSFELSDEISLETQKKYNKFVESLNASPRQKTVTHSPFKKSLLNEASEIDYVFELSDSDISNIDSIDDVYLCDDEPITDKQS